MSKEIWKPVVGYETMYKISSNGRVKRLQGEIFVKDESHHREYKRTIYEKIITQFLDSSGYPIVNIGKVRARVHVLVANAFLEKIKTHQCVNHKDSNRSNNKINNLEWCTFKQNSRHAIEKGRFVGKMNPKTTNVRMLTENGEYLEIFNSITEACRYFGKGYRGNITEVCQGKRQKALGYRWEYANEKQVIKSN